MAKQSGNLIPLMIFVVLLAVLAVVGFVAWTIVNEVSDKTRQKLQRKNMSFSKEGMKVGVKGKSQEEQEDQAQRWDTQCHIVERLYDFWGPANVANSLLTKVWNNAELPGSKSPVLDGVKQTKQLR